MRLGVALALALLAPALAGCLNAAEDGPGAESPHAEFPACEHPWPCGDGSEWPAGVVAPPEGFEVAEVLHLQAPMEDGVTLDGAVWKPDVPDDVRVPVVLWVTPYAGQCRPPSCDDAPADSEELRDIFSFLWQNGYAAAAFNLRGTGLSGGCFDYYGARSQQDVADLVTWLADQPWSNGRVGMWGISAMGTTPWMAAIHAPPALKTIVPSGIISDLYLNRFTPQGAPGPTSGVFQARWGTMNSPAPPGGAFTGQDYPEWADTLTSVAANHPDRVCPDVAEWLTSAARAQFTDDRRPGFWAERRLVTHFGNVTAAVLVQHGFREGGHAFQEDAIWPTLENAPRRFLLGQWGHDLFPDEGLTTYPGGNATTTVLLDWFDFWLKGLGDPPRVGAVDYHAADGDWASTTSWPPAEARAEVLYLADARAQPTPGDGASLRAAQAPPPPVAEVETPVSGCGGHAEGAEEAGAIVRYVSEPVTQDVIVAGNPMAYLELTSDAPGGTITVDVHVVDAAGACRPLQSHGGADLRFHEGNAEAEPFPTDAPTWVRADLWSTAFRIPEGERLLVTLSGSGEKGRLGRPQYAPGLHVSGESHLVLPLVEGTLGGDAPDAAYPPRPFVPATPGATP